MKATWVFVVGMYRTASTCQYLLTEDVVQETDSGIGIGYHTEAKLKDFDDYQGRYVVCKVFKYLPETSEWGQKFLQEGRIKAVGTVRDPRDIITSMMRRAGGQWDFEKVVRTELPVWIRQFEKWVALGSRTRVVRYEDMVVDLRREVERIAAFLDIELPEGMDVEIARRYTVEAQKRRAEQIRGTGQREHPWLPSIPGIVFGTSGQWQEYLSPAQARLIEAVAEAYMRRWKYL